MLKNKIGKIVTTTMVSAAMLANTAAVLPECAMQVFAGEQLGQNTFDDGVGLPWHICESGPAQLDFNIDGGTYNITIQNQGGAAQGGESRWDCQFRHRGLKIVAGHSYTVKAEVTASQSGEIYTKIGNLAGDLELWHNGYGSADGNFGASWNCMPVTANSKLTINSTWTASQSLEVAEWAWHFGGAGAHQATDCFPVGTTLKFDNMYLIDNSGTENDYSVLHPVENHPENNVHVNQVGYFTKLQKQATLHFEGESDYSSSAQSFDILDASGSVVYTGTSTPMGYDDDSGDYVHVLDFSDFQTAGTGYTISCNGGSSYSFNIDDDVYTTILRDSLNYYYQNRSGIAINTSYVTSTGDDTTDLSMYAHQAGHNPDTAYIQSKWVKSYLADGSDVDKSSGTLNGTGGWYDAGDHGKYVVNGGISVWTLQNMYERALSGDNNSKASKWDDGATMVIPETSNGYPDILDECRVELEWMFKMIVGSGYSMTYDASAYGGADTGSYTNMVYHKLHDHKWTGLAVRPYDYEEEWGTIRIVKPPSTAATLNLVACAAQAARLWEDYDADFAKTCLDNAKKCYTAAKANPELYAPLDQAIGGGAYGDNNVADDFYWAACELYISTGDTTYLADVTSDSEYALILQTYLEGGENNGSFGSFNWGNTASLGTLSLYLNQDVLTADQVSTIESSIQSVADTYIAQEDATGYGIPYKGTTFSDPVNLGPDVVVTGYEWGSNSFVVNNAIVMAYAYDVTGDVKYINGAATAMDYIFGRNALDFSYVTGYGTYYCENPHHRYWSYELDPSFPQAPDGIMSGGANAGMQDPYIQGAGYKRGDVPSQLCYIDSVEAWSVNEVTINWQAPFAWIVSFLEDEAPYVDATEVTQDPVWGDANVDGEVKMNDIILLTKVTNDAATLTAQGKINSNVILEGDENVTAADSSKILTYLSGQLSYEELSPYYEG